MPSVSIWRKGSVRTDRLQADRFGYTALARYLMKEPEGAKRYFCSRNLKEPVITVSDTKLSIRKAERIAQSAARPAGAKADKTPRSAPKKSGSSTSSM